MLFRVTFHPKQVNKGYNMNVNFYLSIDIEIPKKSRNVCLCLYFKKGRFTPVRQARGWNMLENLFEARSILQSRIIEGYEEGRLWESNIYFIYMFEILQILSINVDSNHIKSPWTFRCLLRKIGETHMAGNNPDPIGNASGPFGYFQEDREDDSLTA